VLRVDVDAGVERWNSLKRADDDDDDDDDDELNRL
jgi:hypothetical protein